MKLTGLSAQVRDKNRVNVMIDGKFRFSLDISQLASLKLKVGQEYSEEELSELQDESVYGKVYTRTLEYSLMRPRSTKELRDYLYKKTRPKRRKSDGELQPGISESIADRVYSTITERGYVDDVKFSAFWVENRNLRKGISLRKLRSELAAKGVSRDIIEDAIRASDRSDEDEIKKVIAKKAYRYNDQNKLIAYLARQGYSYDEIKNALESDDQDDRQ